MNRIKSLPLSLGYIISALVIGYIAVSSVEGPDPRTTTPATESPSWDPVPDSLLAAGDTASSVKVSPGMPVDVYTPAPDNPDIYLTSQCTLGPVFTGRTALTAAHCVPVDNTDADGPDIPGLGNNDPVGNESDTSATNGVVVDRPAAVIEPETRTIIGWIDRYRDSDGVDAARVIITPNIDNVDITTTDIDYRSPGQGETVTKVGRTSGTTAGVTEGDMVIRQVGATMVSSYTAETCALPGDSGGPVYDSAGAVIGMTIYNIQPDAWTDEENCGPDTRLGFVTVSQALEGLGL